MTPDKFMLNNDRIATVEVRLPGKRALRKALSHAVKPPALNMMLQHMLPFVGKPMNAESIGDLIGKAYSLVLRNSPSVLEPTTWSLLDLVARNLPIDSEVRTAAGDRIEHVFEMTYRKSNLSRD